MSFSKRAMPFSVVITTQNRRAFLSRAVLSILANTLLPSEIIIVNDGGRDIDTDTGPFNSQEVPILVINNTSPMGANYARNQGVYSAVNEIVFFLDDDDAVISTSFETRLIAFDSDSVGLSYTGIHIVRDVELDRSVREVKDCALDINQVDLLTRGNLIGSTSRVAIRKKYFIEAGGFDQDLDCFQDYDLWIRMAGVAEVRFDQQSSVLYTIHSSGNQTSAKFEKYLKATDYLTQKYKYELDKRGAYRSFRSNLYLRVALSAAKVNASIKRRYSLKSFLLKPSLKSFVLAVMPVRLLKKMYPFV